MTGDSLKDEILDVLSRNPGVTAREIASDIDADRRSVNQYLYANRGITVSSDSSYRWYLHERVEPRNRLSAQEQELETVAPVGDSDNVVPATDPGGELISEVLESLRKRLLDLTSRNRLLYFRHPKSSSIRVIDELPNQLKEYLADNEKEMRFIPVPDPTRDELVEAGYIEIDPETGEETLINEPSAKDWAEWLGLHTNYQAPEVDSESDDTKHSDNAIQTMLFPDELEARLRSMRQKANSAIEETGANILYLALGFLEWFEQRDAEAKRLAPLYLIPVRLERGKLNYETKTYEYRLRYSGEDILTNISLREKLKNDFGIALPELADSVAPEEYIASVADAVKTREPNWATRRFVTLCHLNFSKQLLYLDLDPENWPAGMSLTRHPLVKKCLAGLSEEDSDDDGMLSYGGEHVIDDIEDIHDRYPLIEDADSSQHSALIDAIDGKNLVVEGPPGTGKSQTITNLIAAAISNAKKVLFVAEKSAALEVVKRRLDQAGLGAFCLELHSHRSQKRRVLDDIEYRLKLERRLRRPHEIDSDIAFFEDLKEKLREHAALVNRYWKNTETSIHQILSAATRYRNELAISPDVIHPDGLGGETFTLVEKRKILAHAATFSSVYDGILQQLGNADCIYEHPWCGVQSISIQAFEQDAVVEQLRAWQENLRQLEIEISKFDAAVESESEVLPRELGAIRLLVDQIKLITACDGSEPLAVLPKLRGDAASEFDRGVQTYKAIQDYFEDVAKDVRRENLQDTVAIRDLVEGIEAVAMLAAPELRILEVREARSIAKRVSEVVSSLAAPIEQTNQTLALSGDNCLGTSVAGLADFVRLAEIVASLRPEYFRHRSDVFDNDELDQAISSLGNELKTLTEERVELAEVYAVDALPSTTRLREMEAEFRQAEWYCWLSSNWRRARKDLLSVRASKRVRTKKLKSDLKRLVEYALSKEGFEQSADHRRLLGQYFKGLKTDIVLVTKLRAWYRSIREEYGIGFGAKVVVGDAIIGVSEGLARALRSLCKQGLRASVEEVKAELNKLASWLPGLPELSKADSDLAAEHSDLGQLISVLSNSFERVDAALLNEQIRIEAASSVARNLTKLAACIDVWEKLDFCDHYFDGEIQLPIGADKTDAELLARLKRVANISKLLASTEFPQAISDKIYREPSRTTIDLIRIRNDILGTAVSQELSSCQAFSDKVQLDDDAWLATGTRTIDVLIARNQRAIESPEWLSSWQQYTRAKHQLVASGWGRMAKAIEAGTISSNNWEAAVALGASDLLAREILSQTPELSTFSGLAHEGLQQQFQEYDDKLRDLQRQLIAFKASRVTPPAGTASGRVGDYTELALLEHEIGKKTRHIPLRQLVARAGRAILELKPCFMMGPMSVAQYLKPGELSFDLVVMDEASQVRPEEAIGAVARGGQLVVVGDPKQLPPTSFFDKLLDDDDEQDEQTAGQQSESILDAARTTFPARRLRWHYRSQHESLIAFSNHAFYGSDLVIFPSPINKAPEYGVQFTYVKRGRFFNQVNREEAAIIAKAVRNHMLSRPAESIGVVAMSAKQREQIERAIEQETKEDAQFRSVVDENSDKQEPLFVKNLENVQGDERDVIYISMTYGPAEIGGKVAQRFGPINSIHGWRRLNVLFTRAKKRMHVFSSMRSDDVIVLQTSSRGVKSLKGFLEYAATGNLSSTIHHTGRDPDSDFEVAVADALSDYGFECVPQVGVAGYFLDIAVKDPGRPGRYLMAIECDGATYHSAKSTRDRDRLRQRILERLGWRVRRIWSTDWFNNPAAQLKPIVDELKGLRTVAPPELMDEIDETDEIEEIAEELEHEGEFVATIVEEEMDLRTRLEKFGRDVICAKHPDTAPDRRFLKPAMIDALLLYKPTTIWEFQQQVPPYLRRGTEPKEGEFIEPVLEIIYESER